MILDDASVWQVSPFNQSDSIDYRCYWLEPRADHHVAAGSLCILMQADIVLAQPLIYTAEGKNITFQNSSCAFNNRPLNLTLIYRNRWTGLMIGRFSRLKIQPTVGVIKSVSQERGHNIIAKRIYLFI